MHGLIIDAILVVVGGALGYIYGAKVQAKAIAEAAKLAADVKAKL